MLFFSPNKIVILDFACIKYVEPKVSIHSIIQLFKAFSTILYSKPEDQLSTENFRCSLFDPNHLNWNENHVQSFIFCADYKS